MRATAIRPRHLLERHHAEVGATDIAASVPIVTVDEEASTGLDLLERVSRSLIGANTGAQIPECGELTLPILAGEEIGEDRREHRATLEQPPA